MTKQTVPADTAQNLADALNAYEGDNHWNDVVLDYRQYLDEPAIEAADPSYASDIVILLDGSQVIHDHSARTWRVRG